MITRVLLLCHFALLCPPLLVAQQADPDKSYSIKEHPLDTATRYQLTYLGYEISDAKDVVYNQDKRPLTRTQMEDLFKTGNFKSPALNDYERYILIGIGLQLDEASGQVINPFNIKPLTRVELDYVRYLVSRETEHAVIERLATLLGSTPGHPLAAHDIETINNMSNKLHQVISPAVAGMLDARWLSSAQSWTNVNNAYAQSTKRFDGMLSLGAYSNYALAYSPDRARESHIVMNSWPKMKPPPPLINEAQRRLDTLLRDRTAKYFNGNSYGKEQLKKFPNGLPPFQIINLESMAAAIYNPATGAIALNYSLVLRDIGIGTGMPEESIKALMDPQKLAAYIADSPKCLDAFFNRNAHTVSHELQHAAEYQNGLLEAELNRGNTPNVNFLIREYRGFIAQNLYLHAQLKSDPDSLADHPDREQYIYMLSDLNAYLESITKSYIREYPSQAATIPMALGLQTAREQIARQLMSENRAQQTVQGLKLKGMQLGTQAMKRAQADYDAEMTQFLQTDYPHIRREGYAKLAELAMRQEKRRDEDGKTNPIWEDALYLRQHLVPIASALGKEQEAMAKADVERSAKSMSAWLLGLELNQLPFNRWVKAISVLQSYYYDYAAKHQQLPDDLNYLKRRVYRASIAEIIPMLYKQDDKNTRDDELNTAEAMAKDLNDPAFIKMVQDARYTISLDNKKSR